MPRDSNTAMLSNQRPLKSKQGSTPLARGATEGDQAWRVWFPCGPIIDCPTERDSWLDRGSDLRNDIIAEEEHLQHTQLQITKSERYAEKPHLAK